VFLAAGGAAVLAGGGAGVGVALTRPRPRPPAPPAAPAVLVEALAAERALLADLDASTDAAAAAVRRDHAAHATVLQGAIAATGARPAPAATPTGRARSRDELRAAEQAAAQAGAARASRASGAHAALLASIAACEASHAELLR
jgi:hypothetical protein